jgi:hypothetical protein
MASIDPEDLGCSSEVSLFWTALESIVPGDLETMLLRALLLEEREAAAEAWVAWRARVGSARPYFERNVTGLKGLLPYVHFAVQRHGLEADQSFSVYLLAARLREELRLKIIREVAGEILGVLRARAIEPIFTGGYPIAETAYPQAALRHCHGLYLFVADSAATIRALEPTCTRISAPMFVADGVLLQHSCRLPILISSRLLQMPAEDRISNLARSSAPLDSLGPLRARRLAPGDGLLDALAPAILSNHRLNLRWAIDSVSLMRSEGASIWEPFLKSAAYSGLALPLLHLMAYLKRNLEAPVPSSVLERLAALANVYVPGLDALILAARSGARERVGAILAKLPNGFERIRLIRALLLPAPRSLRWKYSNLPALNVPALYAWHTMSFLVRRLRRQITAEDLELVPVKCR